MTYDPASKWPAPALDEPLDARRLPASPPDTARRLELCADLARLEDLVSRVVQDTAGVALAPVKDSARMGLSCVRLTFRADHGAAPGRLAACAASLGHATGRAPVRILAGDPVVVELPLHPGERRFVPLSFLVAEAGAATAETPVQWLLGRGDDGDPCLLDVDTAGHLLVAGSPGSGRRGGLHGLIAGLAFRYAPSRVRICLVDADGVDFAAWAAVPHLARPVVHTAAGLAHLVTDLGAELHRRQRRRARDPRAAFPTLVCVLSGVPRLGAGLARLVEAGRELGVRFVVSTRRPSVESVPGHIKPHLRTGVAFRTTRPVESRLVIHCGDAVDLLGGGDALVLAPTALLRVQAPAVRAADLDALQPPLDPRRIAAA